MSRQSYFFQGMRDGSLIPFRRRKCRGGSRSGAIATCPCVWHVQRRAEIAERQAENDAREAREAARPLMVRTRPARVDPDLRAALVACFVEVASAELEAVGEEVTDPAKKTPHGLLRPADLDLIDAPRQAFDWREHDARQNAWQYEKGERIVWYGRDEVKTVRALAERDAGSPRPAEQLWERSGAPAYRARVAAERFTTEKRILRLYLDAMRPVYLAHLRLARTLRALAQEHLVLRRGRAA